jgi:xanthine dehydrogenase accessory factor
VIGLGPGFIAGVNCDAVIETKRGHFLGRVYWSGTAEKDTGLPEPVSNFEAERVLRAPAAGMLITTAEVGDEIQAGGLIANVGDHEVRAQFHGVLRGLLPNGMQVTDGMKIGDLDPRIDGRYYRHISDKALAIGGGVLEAIFAKENLRKRLIEP